MGNNWKELTIDELKAPTKSAIAMGPFGSRIKAENFVDTGVPILKGGNLHKAFITEDKLDYLTVSKAEELKTSQAIRRDLVITHRGTIGQVSIIPDNSLHDKYIVSQSQLKVTLNQDLVNPYYVNYFFRSRLGQHRLLANSSQVGVPAIAKASTSVKSILVPCPDLKEQNKIVEVLSSLDNKIELNQQTNQTLEKMAQALFKSWFVDFDPVFDNLLASVDFKLENLETSLPDELIQKAQRRLAALNSLHNAAECKASLSALAHELQALSQTKAPTPAAVQVSEKAAETPVKANVSANRKILTQHANTHAHFPNEFEHNEQLGWIPKGWVSNYLDELVEIASSKRVFAKDYVESGVPFYRGKEITELSLGRKVNTEIFISEDKYQELKLKAGAPKFGDILITSVGTIGNAYLVNKDDKFYFKDGNLTWIKGYKKTKTPHYLIEWLKSSRGKESIENIKIGTTQQAITIKSLNKIKILAPTTKVSELFESYCSSSYLKVVANNNQSHNLASTRDTLLPKLISGELHIPDVATDEEVVN